MDQQKRSPLLFPNPWAAEWGEDIYGLWQALIYKDIRYVFRWIEAGEFNMGSPEDEPGRWGKEETLHKVALTNGFWLGETAVTQALWQAVMGGNPSSFTDDNFNPVDTVSWDDSKEFIEKLDQLLSQADFFQQASSKLTLRLPYEAEWEYACRAGTTTPFYFGDNITTDQVNYNGGYPYNEADKGKYRQKTAPVKSLPSNDWGLYEMHGNLWEWCEDWYQEDLGAEPVINPTGAKAGSDRVLRGGGWRSGGGNVRSAIRYSYSPDSRDFSIGLRLAIGQSSISLLKQKSR